MNKYYISIIIGGILLFCVDKIIPQNLQNTSGSFHLSNIYKNNSIKKIQYDTTNDFPLQVGDSWTYNVTDSIKNFNDTVTVKIKNVNYLPNGIIRYLWLYRFTNKIDSLYLERKIDTLIFVPISSDGFYNGISKLVLPLKVGNRWGGIGDEAGSIDSIDTITAPGGIFNNVFQAMQAGICCNDYSLIQYWIQPEVGIVEEINSIFTSVEPNSRKLEKWELLYYSINNVAVTKDNKINHIKFSLYQNYPNPFNPTTTINYSIPKLSYVTLKIFNTLGKLVTTIVNESQNAGYYKVGFNASNLASGVYFYQLRADDFAATKKLLLLK